MSSIIKSSDNPNARKPDEKRDFNLCKCGVEAGEKLMIEKAIEWFNSQKEKIGISSFDEFKIKFREAM